MNGRTDLLIVSIKQVRAAFTQWALPRSAAAERARLRPGPKAVNRQVDASVEDSTAPMTSRLFDHAQRRDPQRRRRWIVLVDGNNHQLDRIHAEAHARGVSSLM